MTEEKVVTANNILYKIGQIKRLLDWTNDADKVRRFGIVNINIHFGHTGGGEFFISEQTIEEISERHKKEIMDELLNGLPEKLAALEEEFAEL